MDFKNEEQLVKYINKTYTPQDLKVKKSILSTQKNLKGECKVYIELRYYSAAQPEKNKRKFLSTEIWVLPKSWSSKKQEVLKTDAGFQDKNRVINDLYSRVTNYVNNPSIDYIFAQLSRDEFLLIEDVFPSKRLLEYKKSLLNYIEQYIEYRKKSTVRSTYKEFTTMMNRIKAFDLYNNKKTYLSDINFSWSEELAEFLRHTAKYSEGTIEKTYTILITVLNHYWKKKDELNLEMNDKFRERGFKHGQKSVNEANPLTIEQLEVLRNFEFERKDLNQTKDRFIWQCYTGIRYVDAFTINSEHVKNGWLNFMPSKTERYRVKVKQPLHPIAKEIFIKYGMDMKNLDITNQAYNRSLIEMFTILNEKQPVKFDVNFGTYASRDTFISMCVEKGVDWKTILGWVGQSSYTIMHRYIKTQDEYQQEQMNKLN